MRLQVLAAAGACVCVGAGIARAEPPTWNRYLYNPVALQDDVVLPLLSGGAMVFRPVAVPASDHPYGHAVTLGNDAVDAGVERVADTAPEPSRLSAALEAAVEERLRACWNPYFQGAVAPVVEIRALLRPDATVEQAQVVDMDRYLTDPIFRSVADRAWRAVLNPHCQPLPLPADRYEDWYEILLIFDPDSR